MEKKNAGFTLMEVLITIAIIGIVTAIAIPNFITFLPRWRAKVAATDLFSNLQLTKMTAIRKGQNVSVTFTGNSYVIGLINKTVQLSEYKSGIEFRGPAPEYRTVEVSPLTFNSRGMLTTAEGYAYFSSGDIADGDPDKVYYRAGATTAGVISMEMKVGDEWQ
jgi:prepilin-type N-terminal cleavage/methylation domain-containing protein